MTNKKLALTMLNNQEQTTKNKQPRTYFHLSVLSKELIEGLKIVSDGHYLDATAGGGGHSSLILAANAGVKVTAIDRDEWAIAAATEKLAPYGSRVSFWQGNFADFKPVSGQFDGIIADLGVSSAQLDNPSRGFSFKHTGSLDMRMDRSQSLTAATIINHFSFIELVDIFSKYGEERFSLRFAKRIVRQRPFQTTTDLAQAIAATIPPKYRHGKIHPATRVFQALRIAVNLELQSLERFLTQAPYWLKPRGIIGIISFHSLEDRIVKHRFREADILQVLTKKPITPVIDERGKNTRSRSAKLRFAQRV